MHKTRFLPLLVVAVVFGPTPTADGGGLSLIRRGYRVGNAAAKAHRNNRQNYTGESAALGLGDTEAALPNRFADLSYPDGTVPLSAAPPRKKPGVARAGVGAAAAGRALPGVPDDPRAKQFYDSVGSAAVLIGFVLFFAGLFRMALQRSPRTPAPHGASQGARSG